MQNKTHYLSHISLFSFCGVVICVQECVQVELKGQLRIVHFLLSTFCEIKGLNVCCQSCLSGALPLRFSWDPPSHFLSLR